SGLPRRRIVKPSALTAARPWFSFVNVMPNAANEPRANSLAVCESGDRRERTRFACYPSFHRALNPMVFATIVDRAAGPFFRVHLTPRAAPRTISLLGEHAISNAVCLPVTGLPAVCELMSHGPA